MVRVFLTAITLGLLSFTSAAPDHAVATPAATLADTKEVIANNAGGAAAAKEAAFDNHVQELYNAAGLKQKGLSYEVFEKAVVGFQNFKRLQVVAPKKSIISVVDFTKPSSQKRLWIIDLNAKKVLFNTLVAHGRNTGQDKATQFSNTSGSYMSSLGFYLTDATYFGKHGLSLRLQGMDEGYNSNAMERAIVVHGADYVSENFVKQYGRLGRSLGCPSVPKEISKDVIETIKDKSVLYIHGNDSKYTSRFLDDSKAVEYYAAKAATDVMSI
ncbi:murein L,D-transpeptidase catalytic domain family protein [Pontibacter anaerobius]|uniref:Murein L,D-transpeptidase catalytic domain family protein n=1 Tax=Pontibacter anaerobius TaxID=2993940 RepID=A0ABT3RIN9_9BACT|nr:murein L,D-transpeptidase catalytic domain family protein [Pontibacter anaerobius]MCX2741492.1 murein L,D-transpeptidase catalytic domain family protein [Pontibacter anaerobius]